MANSSQTAVTAGANDVQLVTLTIAQLRTLVAIPQEPTAQRGYSSRHREHSRSANDHLRASEDSQCYEHHGRFVARSRSPPRYHERRARSLAPSRYNPAAARNHLQYFDHRVRSRSPAGTRDSNYSSGPRSPSRRPHATEPEYDFQRYLDYHCRSPPPAAQHNLRYLGQTIVGRSPHRLTRGSSLAPNEVLKADCYRPGWQGGCPPRSRNHHQQKQPHHGPKVGLPPAPTAINTTCVNPVVVTSDANSKHPDTTPSQTPPNEELESKAKRGTRRRRRGSRASDKNSEAAHMPTRNHDPSLPVEAPARLEPSANREQQRQGAFRRTEELRSKIKAERSGTGPGGDDVSKLRVAADQDENGTAMRPVRKTGSAEVGLDQMITRLLRGANPRKLMIFSDESRMRFRGGGRDSL